EVATNGDEEATGDPTEAAEEPTPLPPSPDDLETAREIADGWAQLWTAEDYRGLYELTSQETRGIISRDEFVTRYEAIAQELAETEIEVEVTGGIEEALRFTLSVKRDSARVGQFEEEILHPLTEESQGRIRVDWSPSVIVDDLAD